MAISLFKDDITSARGGGADSGKTFVRTMFFRHESRDTMVDCINSTLFPGYRDCHPTYTAFVVTDISEVENFGDDLFKVEITYTHQVSVGEVTPKDTPPWQLPPQNVSINTFDKEIAMTRYWDPNLKKWRELLNSAGCRIVASKTVTVGTLSFTMNERKSSSVPSLNAAYLYNAETETVCGIKIPAYCGKLLPFSATLHTVTNSATGRVQYEYYAIDVTIHMILPTGDDGNENWMFSLLDIGTLARDDDGNLGAIYKFREAKNKTELATAPVKYGSIDALTLQRNQWTDDLASFPFEEITEPMPLNDGKVYVEAIQSVDGSVPYGKIEGFDSRPASWSKFGLPKRR